MIVLAYLGSQCTNFRVAGWTCWFLTSFYLESEYLAWCDFAMVPTTEQHKILSKSRKRCDEDPGNDTSVGGRKQAPYTESPNSSRPKNGETGEGQSQEHAHHFLWHKGDCPQRIRPGRTQSILHTTVTFYGDCVNIHPELWRQKKNWLLHHGNALSHTSFLTRELFFFTKNNDCRPPPTLLFCFPDWR
jgi:hypothetical protein